MHGILKLHARMHYFVYHLFNIHISSIAILLLLYCIEMYDLLYSVYIIFKTL
jgi:hypothetical protein